MVPEKSAELFARGVKFGENRAIGGVHYESDVAAGRISAAVIANAMFHNQTFMEDFKKAKAELRAYLGY
jgi:acid phosphatase (class A)